MTGLECDHKECMHIYVYDSEMSNFDLISTRKSRNKTAYHARKYSMPFYNLKQSHFARTGHNLYSMAYQEQDHSKFLVSELCKWVIVVILVHMIYSIVLIFTPYFDGGIYTETAIKVTAM